MGFTDAAKVTDILNGQMKVFTVNSKEIIIVNYEDQYFAINSRCTHMRGELVQGKLEGKIVTCPKHGAKFDVTSGKCISGPKMGLIKGKTSDIDVYEVKVENSIIKVNV